jgi:hypothetical protein
MSISDESMEYQLANSTRYYVDKKEFVQYVEERLSQLENGRMLTMIISPSKLGGFYAETAITEWLGDTETRHSSDRLQTT